MIYEPLLQRALDHGLEIWGGGVYQFGGARHFDEDVSFRALQDRTVEAVIRLWRGRPAGHAAAESPARYSHPRQLRAFDLRLFDHRLERAAGLGELAQPARDVVVDSAALARPEMEEGHVRSRPGGVGRVGNEQLRLAHRGVDRCPRPGRRAFEGEGAHFERRRIGGQSRQDDRDDDEQAGENAAAGHG